MVSTPDLCRSIDDRFSLHEISLSLFRWSILGRARRTILNDGEAIYPGYCGDREQQNRTDQNSHPEARQAWGIRHNYLKKIIELWRWHSVR